MTVGAGLALAAEMLARAGVDTPRVDAEWLLADVLDTPRLALHMRAVEPLAEVAAQRFAVAVARRARREPLQRIIGWQPFRGVRVRLTADVLVPRPETEALVDLALGLVATTARPRIVDVGVGSGCIAAAIVSERPDARVVAIDVCGAAAGVARDNARGAHVLVGDLLGSVRDASVDLIVGNLPYLPTALLATLSPEVAAFEPKLALDGGADGLDVVRRLVPEAARALRAGGALALETTGGPQADATARLLVAAGFRRVVTQPDLAGVVRFVAGLC